MKPHTTCPPQPITVIAPTARKYLLGHAFACRSGHTTKPALHAFVQREPDERASKVYANQDAM